MATVNLIHKRVGNDIKMAVQVLDNGVALDWTSVTRIYAALQSDSQRIRMGMCRVDGPDSEDPTKLLLTYPAKSPQYAGVARLVLECNYMGSTATLDTPAFVFVASTAEEGTGPVTVEVPASVDPETNNLQILVADVDTSVLDDAIQAANEAATAANAAAEAAGGAVATLEGGTTGQVLAKASDDPLDFQWQDPWAGSEARWGEIAGTLSDQTDLKNALDAKQDVIADLSDIRSGAEAGATAYQKPSGGIPAADIAAGVIPSAPGTLNTDNSSSQSVNSSEALSGTVKLHKISKTGKFSDLADKPTSISGYGITDAKIENGTVTLGSNSVTPLTSESDPVFSASPAAGITSGDITSWNGKYTKPSGGIPAADIEAGVIPTVPVISTDISADATSDTKTASPKAVKTYADTKYAKPSGGIPSSDMATAVQTTLGLANSAYQKPQNGIPASDLESGVIPTVPTISTNITTDAASTTKTAAPKAVVDYVPTVAVMLASGMSTIKVWVGTQADYNLLTPANDTLYFIKS